MTSWRLPSPRPRLPGATRLDAVPDAQQLLGELAQLVEAGAVHSEAPQVLRELLASRIAACAMFPSTTWTLLHVDDVLEALTGTRPATPADVAQQAADVCTLLPLVDEPLFESGCVRVLVELAAAYPLLDVVAGGLRARVAALRALRAGFVTHVLVDEALRAADMIAARARDDGLDGRLDDEVRALRVAVDVNAH